MELYTYNNKPNFHRFPEIEDDTAKKGDGTGMYINPMFNRNEKIPTSTSGTSEPPGSKRLSFESSEKHDVIHANDKTNVSQENNEKITGNRTEPDGDHNRGGRSSSAGNVSYVYSPNRGTNGLQQRRPSIGSVTQYSVGNKDGLYRYQSTGSVPLQRPAIGPVSPNSNSRQCSISKGQSPQSPARTLPRISSHQQQQSPVWTKRQVSAVCDGDSISKQGVTMPLSHSHIKIHGNQSPIIGRSQEVQTTQSQLPNSVRSVIPSYSGQSVAGSSPNQANYTASSATQQLHNDNPQASTWRRPIINSSMKHDLTGRKSQESPTMSRNRTDGVSSTRDPKMPNIVTNPEYDARLSPMWRRNHAMTPGNGSPRSLRAEKQGINSGSTSVGSVVGDRDKNSSSGLLPDGKYSKAASRQKGDQAMRSTTRSEFVSPLDSHHLRLSDLPNTLSLGNGTTSFHPFPSPPHDMVNDSSEDDLYSIVRKGTYSCAVADPNLNVSQYPATAFPRNDEIKYVAVRVPREV